MFKYLLILTGAAVMSSGIVFAYGASQTDWIGGPYVQPPSETWSDTFNSSQNCNYQYPGILSLAFEIIDMPAYFNICEGFYSDAGDCDGDGDIDIFYTGNDTIFTVINANSAGTLWIPGDTLGCIEYSYWRCIKSTDIDEDNDVDLIASHNANGVYILSWFENTSQDWQEHFISSSEEFNYTRISCEDFDGDGDQDIISASETCLDPNIIWIENKDGSGGSWSEHPVSYEDYPVSIYPADCDDDGDIDVIGIFKYSASVYENADGIGTVWIEHSVAPVLNRCLDGSCADVDNDGDVDIFVLDVNSTEFTTCLYRNEGDYSWQRELVETWIPETPFIVLLCILHAIDTELDGSSDICISYAILDNSMNPFGELYYVENSNDLGTEWNSTLLVDSNPNYFPGCMHSADISGDGAPDLVLSPYANDSIVWWQLSEGYAPLGDLYSNILEIPMPIDDVIDWGAITFDASVPSQTGLEFYVRGSDDPENLGEWSEPIVTSGTSLQGILDNTDFFIQYRASMNSNLGNESPVLENIQLEWDLLGLEEETSTTDEYCLFLPENPSYGILTVGFSIPEITNVRIDIFDISGRLVNTPITGEFSLGLHQVHIDDLSSGIYFCRMSTDDFAATCKLLFLE
ncbi:MAG: T9SS type A sorting domain-containing protein [Candidatus Aegiribacteria sp.]|nr:T9SS type A sorting domain-containing protein [Candidatus Aegiribacteria sp.]